MITTAACKLLPIRPRRSGPSDRRDRSHPDTSAFETNPNIERYPNRRNRLGIHNGMLQARVGTRSVRGVDVERGQRERSWIPPSRHPRARA
jgi:hypothetical protein